MKLQNIRRDYTKRTSISDLTVDGMFACYFLEDVRRAPGVKVPGKTCIPAGTYRVMPYNSPKHGCVVPLLEAVPGFDHIEIHWGNKAEDTDGCLLTGLTKGKDWVGNSRLAWEALMAKIRPAWERDEEVWIEVIDTQGPQV